MMTSRQHGGFRRGSFTPTNRLAPARFGRDLGARQRFIHPKFTVNGNNQIVLDPDERLIVGQDEAGNVTIEVEPANRLADEGNGNGGKIESRLTTFSGAAQLEEQSPASWSAPGRRG